MDLTLKILCGLLALLMAVFGAQWWFGFDSMAGDWMVTAQNLVGVNNLTADMGALFFGTALMVVLGLVRGGGVWLQAAAALMAIAALGRLVSFATAGYTGEVLVALIVEIVAAGLFFFAAGRLARPAL